MCADSSLSIVADDAGKGFGSSERESSRTVSHVTEEDDRGEGAYLNSWTWTWTSYTVFKMKATQRWKDTGQLCDKRSGQ